MHMRPNDKMSFPIPYVIAPNENKNAAAMTSGVKRMMTRERNRPMNAPSSFGPRMKLSVRWHMQGFCCTMRADEPFADAGGLDCLDSSYSWGWVPRKVVAGGCGERGVLLTVTARCASTSMAWLATWVSRGLKVGRLEAAPSMGVYWGGFSSMGSSKGEMVAGEVRVGRRGRMVIHAVQMRVSAPSSKYQTASKGEVKLTRK